MLDEETSENHKAIEGGEESAEKAQESSQKPEPSAESKRSAPSSPSKSSQVQVKKKSQSPTTGPDNQTLLRLLEQGEQLHSMFRCARVQGLDTLEGLLLFGKDHYYVVDGFTLLKTREIRDLDFLPEQYHDPIIPYMAMGSTSRPTSTKSNRQCNKFSYDDIKEVHKRRYLLQPIAIEMFSADGRNYLLAFPRKIRDRVYNKLVSMAKSASSDVAKTMAEQKKLLPTESTSTSAQLINSLMGQQSMTQKWQRGECTNFHYLMYLNTLAGRSYNDLSQYPVFPWILKDYESDQLDLTNPAKTFRDLSRPMGAQTPERLSQFLKRFREWDDPTGDTPPYMYGTHYSSAMIVLSYLVRLEPFTQQFLKLQGGHFDLADRMFHSIRDAYVSASKNNMADVKELIPVCLQARLQSSPIPPKGELDVKKLIPVKQSGLMLNDVQLPKWAHGDSHEFIRIHREALECDYVSEHLHEWIDLIFGYKQTGDAARDSNNVFHHLFYEQNVDFDNIDDPLTRNATLGFINNFGQVPAQLFKKPHPQRKVHPTFSGSGSAGSSASGQSGNSSPQTSMVQLVRGVSTPKLFYHCLESLRPSTNKPVKELKAAIGDILVNEKGQVVVLEQNKILIPPTSFLAWGFHDRSIRVGGVGTDKSHCVLETNDVFEITCMASADGGKVIFGGLTTGTVLVWTLSGLHFSGSSGSSSSSKGHSALRLHPRRALDAHTDVVTALATCPAHNFIVSASRDQTAVIWHLTRLTFIRQLKGHSGAVTAVAVNDVIGDIATASGAQLFLWTLNGVLLASINTAEAGLFTNPSSLILCLGFSTLNEWDLRNVVMCGTSDGLVKIYSCELRKVIVESSQEAHDLNHVENQSSAADPTSKAVKEHLLRRQQRIQNHNRRLASNRSSSSASSEVQSLSMSMGDPMSPLQPGPTSSEDSPFAGAYNGNAGGNNGSDSKLAEIEWKRALHLRRVLSEHTAFSQGNAHPAPITSLRPTKDHKSLLVGDGVGRVWLWTMDNSATPGSNT
ncbi:beige/BEACH domain-containing protein [Ditylenchus destructor]|nr:beige/BEACH domain-containing protein [Ditylenchus destructor]